ncbi:unnamed protein product [Tilletia controversa]|nr:unnamed protein product [Tilletia controversa]
MTPDLDGGDGSGSGSGSGDGSGPGALALALALASKRKRSPSPGSASPPPAARRRRSPSPRNERERERDRNLPPPSTSRMAADKDKDKEKDKGKAKDTAAIGSALRDHLAIAASTTRAGGAYIPPARLRALMAEAAAGNPGSPEYQRMSWDALKKSITGLINKVAADNIKFVVPELFGGANLIRGRGLFCRAIMRAQGLSLPYTPVFAALVAIVNTKLPMIGELLGIRLVSQFRRAFKRNDKPICYSTILFIAHLVNQRVLHEILALEVLLLLLEKPTDDSVELAVGFMREAGAFLAEEAPKASNGVFDRFRAILYEGTITTRIQFMIEVLSQVRREAFKDNPKIPENLDLVEEDDQITHEIGLDSKLNIQEGLNIFKLDPDFLENEDKYRQIKAEILGENDSDGDDEAGDDDDDDDDDEDDEDEAADDETELEAAQRKLEIHDRTETNLVNLRRTIYLTIMSSSIYEEAVHKLLKINMPENQQIEMCNMIIECCSQERTFNKFYAHIGERFCKLNRMWSGCFEQAFHNYYDTIHRYETNRLRNVARFFGSLMATDSISWASLNAIHMNEDDTTSSSRIFTKILFGEMQEILGLKELVSRFKTEEMQPHFSNMFPLDNPKNTRFSVNFFTSIGLGALTEKMREHLKNAPKLILAQRAAAAAAARAARGEDSDSSESSSSSSSDVSSDSSSDLHTAPPPELAHDPASQPAMATPEHDRPIDWDHISHFDRENEEKRFAVLQRDAERERLMWLSMPGNDHPSYYSDSDADGYQSDAPSPAPSVVAAAASTESDPYLRFAVDSLVREDPSTSSFRPIPAPGPAQRYSHHPVLAAEEDEQTRLLVAQKVLHGNRTGNRGNKLKRKEGVRYASRGKLSNWNDGKTEKEMTDSAKQRTKALQRASIRSLLDSAPSPTPSPPFRPRRVPEDWPEPEESNLRGTAANDDDGHHHRGAAAGPSSERSRRAGKARATVANSSAPTRDAVKAEVDDAAAGASSSTGLETYPWLRSHTLGKAAGPYLEDYPQDHDPAARKAHMHPSIPNGQRPRKRRLLQAAIGAAASADGHLDPTIAAELSEAFTPQDLGDADISRGGAGGSRTGGGGSGSGGASGSGSRTTTGTGTENLSSTSLAPTLLRPVLTPLALLESQTLRHTFRNPHIGALSKTALDLIESEDVVSRALGRCFAAIESGGMPGWGAYMEAEERTRRRRKEDEAARAAAAAARTKGKGKKKETSKEDQQDGAGGAAAAAEAPLPPPPDESAAASKETEMQGVQVDDQQQNGTEKEAGTSGPDGDVSMRDDPATSTAVKDEHADHGQTTFSPTQPHQSADHNGSPMDPLTAAAAGAPDAGPSSLLTELDLRARNSAAAPGFPPSAWHSLADLAPALNQVEQLFITPGGIDIPVHHAVHSAPFDASAASAAGGSGSADGDMLQAGGSPTGAEPHVGLSGLQGPSSSSSFPSPQSSSGPAPSTQTAHLDANQQRVLVRAALECVYELAQDSREYIERLQEVREKLAQVKLGRARVWGAVRGWALGEVEDELERRRVERAEERERERERAREVQRQQEAEESGQAAAVGASGSGSSSTRNANKRRRKKQAPAEAQSKDLPAPADELPVLTHHVAPTVPEADEDFPVTDVMRQWPWQTMEERREATRLLRENAWKIISQHPAAYGYEWG